MKVREKTWNGTISPEKTQREVENGLLARKAAAEGFVLLKNEGHLLPMSKGARMGLYGGGAACTVKGGTGSGDVNERVSVTIAQGLRNAGYEITSESWLTAYEQLYHVSREKWRDMILRKMDQMGGNFFNAYSTTPYHMPAGPRIDEETAKTDGADTAVFVLARVAGENADRRDEKGDYFLSEEEEDLLAQLSRCYDHVVLVINAGGPVDLGFLEKYPRIEAVLYYVQAGQEGGNALADVFTGRVAPSGKLVDTWAGSYADYPSADTYSYHSGHMECEVYREGIYVGYRYFDTFEVPVRFGFGHGLSYTSFSWEVSHIIWDVSAKQIRVQTRVVNTGNQYSGKEVLQVYVSCPQGRLGKEFRRLAGFGKTGVLWPGASCDLTVSFSIEQLASYDEERSAWILEEGLYGVWMGDSLESARLAGTLRLDQEHVLLQCAPICVPQETIEEISPDPDRIREREAAWHKEAEGLCCVEIASRDLTKRSVAYTAAQIPLSGPAGEIVEKLSTEQLIHLACGEPSRGQERSALGSAGMSIPGSAAETSSVAAEDPWNVASIVLADGPAGIRLHQTYQVENGQVMGQDFLASFERGYFSQKKEKKGTTYYQYCTAIPVGTLLAQTWNQDLLWKIGEMIGREMELFQVDLWLAPGMNIHRNPLCGRNFEYYSEDPLVSGMTASAIVRGVQSKEGRGATIKHFACNNQEEYRMGSDSILSERALREIYLKGFEIAVRDAQPMAIMTSYNMINGIHAANHYDLCMKAARDEWGFAGAIMTDWTTTNATPRGECTAAGCMRAGNDMVMPGMEMDFESIRSALAEGTLDIMDLKRCVWNTIRIILQSGRYEEAVSYSRQFRGLGTYMTAE
ncbi:MAG: glycoside hydrolase family 3 protein [Lachnospirales bacterium]